MVMFYQAVLESLIKYGITVWLGNFSVQLQNKLFRLIHNALKIIGVKEHLSLQSIYERLPCVRPIRSSVTHHMFCIQSSSCYPQVGGSVSLAVD